MKKDASVVKISIIYILLYFVFAIILGFFSFGIIGALKLSGISKLIVNEIFAALAIFISTKVINKKYNIINKKSLINHSTVIFFVIGALLTVGTALKSTQDILSIVGFIITTALFYTIGSLIIK